MNKRQITLTELEEELRVGTVDLDTIEVIDVPVVAPTVTTPLSADDSNPTPLVAPIGQGDNGDQPSKLTEGLFLIPASLPTADEFLANLAAQADAAIATIVPDVRASVAASVSDSEEIEDAPEAAPVLRLEELDSASVDPIETPVEAVQPSIEAPATSSEPVLPVVDTTVPQSAPKTTPRERRPAREQR